MALSASLHPASTNATTQASSLPPTHYYLARHWCSGARPRYAMNLVCRKSKIREKTGLEAWERRQTQPGVWGCLAVSPRSERSRKRPTLEGERINERGRGGREHLSSASVQWKQVYATLPYLTTSTPPPPPPPPRIGHFPPFSFFFWWHHCFSLSHPPHR